MLRKGLIYLDYNATTPVDPQVLNVMLPYFKEKFGNASCSHNLGMEAREAIEEARAKVSFLLGCSPDEIVFTSGGTESNNLVIFGVASACEDKKGHIIVSKIEHASVIEPSIELMCRGYEVSFVNVDENGVVDPDDVRAAIRPDTVLISIMHANNEIGTIQPIREIGQMAKERGILFHTDAAQSAGKIETMVDDLNVDFLTIAGHKLYAPKGIGALYVRKDVNLKKVLFGAGQEKGLRPGTENVAGIVALGEASDIASKTLQEEKQALSKLRDMLEHKILESIPDAVVHGKKADRLPNTLSIAFPGKLSHALLQKMPHIAASPGSACHSGKMKLSHVMQALGVEESIAMGTIRFSLGRFTTEDEVLKAAEYIIEAVSA